MRVVGNTNVILRRNAQSDRFGNARTDATMRTFTRTTAGFAHALSVNLATGTLQLVTRSYETTSVGRAQHARRQ